MAAPMDPLADPLSMPAALPPPGVEPNFEDPPSQLNDGIAIFTVLLTVSTLAVAMRMYTRLWILRASFGWDDAFCLISQAFNVIYSAFILHAYVIGMGRHPWNITAGQAIDGMMWFMYSTFFYLALTATIKLSLLFMYRRVFSPQDAAKWAITFGIVFVAVSNSVLLIATGFNCRPIEALWNPMLGGDCLDPEILPLISGVLSAVTDLYVLLIPLPILWGLRMGWKQKFRVMAVFGIGIVACAACWVRFAMTQVLGVNMDTWSLARLTVWAALEVNLGIICACLVLLPAFAQRHVPAAVKSFTYRTWSYWTNSTLGGSSKSNSKENSMPRYKQRLDSRGGDAENPNASQKYILRTTDIEMEGARVSHGRDDPESQRPWN